MVTENIKLLMTAAEVSGLLGISRSLFYELHAEGKVPAPVKLGKRVLWRPDELRAWVDADCPNRLEWDQIRNNNN